jgi:hypothetical protein
MAPKKIASMVRKFLIAEAQLNYGDENQTDDETIRALGNFGVLQAVEDGEEIYIAKGELHWFSHTTWSAGVQGTP